LCGCKNTDNKEQLAEKCDTDERAFWASDSADITVVDYPNFIKSRLHS